MCEDETPGKKESGYCSSSGDTDSAFVKHHYVCWMDSVASDRSQRATLQRACHSVERGAYVSFEHK
jgi:hypothetical protein